MARSLAFWFVNPAEKPTVELHFNYWSLASTSIKYLDIGVEISTEGNFESINIYLPFDKSSIEYDGELGSVVCGKTELIAAIFNSKQLEVKQSGNDAFDIVLAENELRFFTQIDQQTEGSKGGVELREENTKQGKGLILTFPVQLFKSRDPARKSYFRFRIKLNENSGNSISQLYKSKGALVTANLDTTEVIDFRVNEPRNLPGKVAADLNDLSPIKAVHFFLIRDADTEFKMSNEKFKRWRLLENDIWEDYLLTGNNGNIGKTDQMLIYHWKDSKKGTKDLIEHFSAFVKFNNRSVNKLKISVIILFIVLFGALGSGLASLLERYFVTSSDDNYVCIETSSTESGLQELTCKKMKQALNQVTVGKESEE